MTQTSSNLDVQLKATIERLKAVYHAIPIPSYTWQAKDGEFILIDFNQAALVYTKEAIKDFIGVSASKLYKNHPSIISDLNRCLADKSSFERELKYKFLRRTHEAILNVKYAFIEPDLILVLTEDITQSTLLSERIVAEQKKSTDKLRQIIQGLPVGLTIIKSDNTFDFINNTLTEMFGYTIDDIPDLDAWWPLAYPDETYREFIKQSWFDNIEKSATLNCRFEPVLAHVRCKNGSYKYFMGSYTPLGDEAIIIFLDVTESQKSEDELRHAKLKAEQSEARLVEAQKTTKVGSWETKMSDLSVIWSEETYHIFELDYYTFKATHAAFLSFVHPDDKLLVDDAFMKSLSTTGYNLVEHKIITSTGTIKHVEERWRIEFDDNGQALRAVGTCQDISYRKKIEQELLVAKEEAEEFAFRLKLATKSGKLGVWDWILDENILIWDDILFEIHGMSNVANPVSFSMWENSIHPDDRQRIIDELNQALIQDPTFDTTFRIIKPNGEIAHISENAVILRDSSSKPLRLIGINRDVTQKYLADHALRDSEQKYRTLFDSSQDSILLLRDGVWVDCNINATKLFNCNQDEIIQSNPGIFSPEYQPNGLSSKAESERRISLAYAGEPQQFEWLHKRLDGSTFSADVSLNRLELDGKPHLQSIIRDISERKSMEAENDKIMADLIQRNKDLEQFSYMVSHNLRAPVANIISVSDYMINYSLSQDEIHILNDGLNKSVQALDTVIKDLNLVLQKRESIHEHKTVVNLSDIVESIKSSISTIIENERVQITTDFSSASELLAIKSYLNSIFTNLLTNSIKYKKLDTDPIIHIETKKLNDGVEILYEDNGLGIDLKKYGDQMFGFYKRFHFHTEGRGVGLYLVKTQVEAMNGTIMVDSEINMGTRFIIYLPN